MLSFAIVSAKPGRAIPAHVRAALADEAPPELAFPPDDHLMWTDRPGRTMVGGWQRGAALLGVGSRWEVRPEGVTLFSGHLWYDTSPWSETAPWASQLADLVDRKGLAEIAPGLDGVFAAASIGADGRGVVCADPLGVAILYRAETPDVVVVATRASLAARLATGRGTSPGRDVEGAAWLAYASNLQTDRTTFEGVRVVPQGSVVHVDPGSGLRVETRSDMPWLPGPDLDGASVQEGLARATTHMRALVRTFTSLPASMRTLELTGGRDSRLILSLLLAEGLAQQVVCITWGGPTLGDVVVATEIADALGLRHRASSRTPVPRVAGGGGGAGSAPAPLDLVDQIRHHVWVTSGARSIWDLGRVHSPSSPAIALTGHFGAALRTNLPRTDGLRRMDDLHAYVRAGALGFDAAGLFRPEARRRHDRLVWEELQSLVPPGGTARDAVDGFNQRNRLRRWFGPAQENDHRNRLFPLYSMPAMQLSFAIGSDLRRAELVPFEVMRACSDELARMPFSGRGWPAELSDRVHDPSAYPWAAPVAPWRPPEPPVPPGFRRRVRTRLRRAAPAVRPGRSPVTTAGEAARMRNLATTIPVLHEMADLDPGHAFFEVIDRVALHRAIDDLGELGFLARRSVHDAVTAAMWLSGAEAPAPLPHDG